LSSVPKIERRWTCIAAADQTLLAAQISSYFNEPGTYFALFEFPAADRPHEEVPTKDGYFAQILGKRAATHINNCLAYIRPESIILLGLSDFAQTYLRAILPAHLLTIVNTESELIELPFAVGAPKPFTCKPSQAIEGLVAARIVNRPLAYSDDAPELPSRQLLGRKGLVVLENRAAVGEVSIINYAASIGADVVLAHPIERNSLQTLPRQLHAWAADHSSPAFREVRRKVADRIKGVDFARYEYATFFTAGLPYGLILQNTIPFTHMLNGPYVGVSIANAISEERSPRPVGSAVLFSLDEFSSDETNDVAERLQQSKFVITGLIGRAATNENLNNYGSYLPYDLLHICSHGGETDGYFVRQEFKDRDGKDHAIEYFEVVSFSLEGAMDPDKVKVESKMIFASFDGLPWIERPLSLYPQYVGDDLLDALRNNDEAVKRTPVNVPIALSCHIKCHHGFHQGAFDNLAAFAHPIIFNNSCSSSHELAAGFLAAGARCYIATLWNVGDKTAMRAALAFYDSVLAQGNILSAFSTMLRSIRNDRYRNIYVLWGLHFSSLTRLSTTSDAVIIAGLLAGYSVWLKKLAKTKDEELKRNSLPAVRFLRSEIRRRITPERLMEMLADFPEEEEEIERSQASSEEDEVTELIVTKEIDRSQVVRYWQS